MSAGEVDYLTNDLIVGFESHSGNDAALVVHYRRCLIGFCNDWRALWYQHGIQESGWPHYQQLLNATRNALPDAEPPILMSDNSTLAKIVFTERLANAALVPEVMEQFVRGVETRPADAASFVASAATASTANRIVTAAGVAGGTDIGRNTRCPCGSGLRYKHCHGAHSMPA